MTREELIEALEKARAPDRRLDAEIAVTLRIPPPDTDVTHWSITGFPRWRAGSDGRVICIHLSGEDGPHWRSKAYTSSIDAALTLVPEGLSYEIRCSPYGETSQAVIWNGRRSPSESEVARVGIDGVRPAIALCIAALRAREET